MSSFYVHLSDGPSAGGCVIADAADSFEAALLFAERWAPEPEQGSSLRVRVVDGATGEQKLWDNLVRVLAAGKYKGVINRGHGSFALGPDLKDCFNTTAMIEHSCKIRYYHDLAKK